MPVSSALIAPRRPLRRAGISGSRIVWMALLMAACGTQPRDARDGAPARADSGSAEDPVTVRSLAGTEWTVVQLRGAPPIPLPPLRLQFDTAQVGGFGGCNWFGIGYRMAGDTIRTGEVSSTLIGCDGPVGEQETALHAAIKEAQRVRIAGDTLQMRNAAGTAVVVAVRRRLAEVDPARLQGGWRLLEMGSAAPPAGANVRLAFRGDSLSAFAGCRDLTGTFDARGRKLHVTSMAMGNTECTREPFRGIENDFITELSRTTDYQIAGDTLTLITSSGQPFRFLRER